ncbi:hypothetical protein FQN58_24570 [Bacteroides xylanisolvens]|uniref:hypothetical protein n=1 Tax=Bacteroides xylanisolvens TaxID=371601 RepID=UPI001BA68929|nr:hypothetical protein [Bacteroides xylanisolvens]QUR46132.1 hypothetical protein FQN58_24570 [Bacteroides xylanisolvens]
MKTVIIKGYELPLVPPTGYKKAVAKAAGVSEKTVYNAIKGGLRGPQSDKVMQVYKELYGKPVRTEVVDK